MNRATRLTVAFLGLSSTHAACYAESDLPPLTATYRLETHTGESGRSEPDRAARSLTWELRRARDCVLVSDAAGRVTERWDRDDQGRIWYRRIFHSERKVIEYQPADLNLSHLATQWATIASVIDPRELDQLTRAQGADNFRGLDVNVYRGTRGGLPTEIGWLPSEVLPERIVVEGKNGTSTLRLINVERDAHQNCEPLDVSSYDTVDFADIGDRHNDPFLERLMRYEGFAHGHR